ncbi:PspC domain-containing protein [Shewanella bicestrii]|uniref:PspC domain-containing protein n=1 Tax=Shewanella seohaensis TaxID=755175 RepID=A0ABV4VTY0_9GAMM
MQNIDNTNILTRGETGVIAGVCSGLAEYYGLRKNGLRFAFAISSFFFAIPVLVYIVLWLVLPKYPTSQAGVRQLRRKVKQRQSIGS